MQLPELPPERNHNLDWHRQLLPDQPQRIDIGLEPLLLLQFPAAHQVRLDVVLHTREACLRLYTAVVLLQDPCPRRKLALTLRQGRVRVAFHGPDLNATVRGFVDKSPQRIRVQDFAFGFIHADRNKHALRMVSLQQSEKPVPVLTPYLRLPYPHSATGLDISLRRHLQLETTDTDHGIMVRTHHTPVHGLGQVQFFIRNINPCCGARWQQ